MNGAHKISEKNPIMEVVISRFLPSRWYGDTIKLRSQEGSNEIEAAHKAMLEAEGSGRW